MMRKMKDSGIEWIGMIPEQWKYARLKHFYKFEKGKNAAIYTQEYIGENEGCYPVYSGQTENNGIMGKINSYDYDIEECLFTTTVGAKVMTPKILNGKFSLSQNCLIMKQIKECNNKYFYYMLLPLFDYEKSLIPTYMQPSLRMEDLRTYAFYIPDSATQKKIADFLDEKIGEIDAIISKTKESIEEYKKYKQAVITETVTKGLDNTIQMKDSGIEWIDRIPSDWDVVAFKKIFSFGKGLSITKADLVDEGEPVISYGQIHSKTNKGVSVDDTLIRFVPSNFLHNCPQALVEKNDFIFADTSEDLTGSGNYVYIGEDKKIFAGYHTIVARPNESEDYKYLAYLFLTDCWRSQIRSRVTGIKLFSISQKILREVSVILPSEKIRKEIVEYLDKKIPEIDGLIEKKEAFVEEMETYKKSLIYDYVTGKKEVL